MDFGNSSADLKSSVTHNMPMTRRICVRCMPVVNKSLFGELQVYSKQVYSAGVPIIPNIWKGAEDC